MTKSKPSMHDGHRTLENFWNPDDENEILQEIETVDLEKCVLEAAKTIEQRRRTRSRGK